MGQILSSMKRKQEARPFHLDMIIWAVINHLISGDFSEWWLGLLIFIYDSTRLKS